jgi:hypothetical protein
MELWGISLTTEQQNTLDETAASIFTRVRDVFMIKDIYDSLDPTQQAGIASPYLNFRDALFHYKKMYDAATNGDNTVFIQQLANIEEHLHRGIKDFAVHLCFNCYVPVIRDMMESRSQCVNDAVFCRLRHIYHELKNIVADIRLGGQRLLRFGAGGSSWLPSMVNIIADFNNLLKGDVQLNNLFQSTLPRIIAAPINPIKS